MPDVSLTGTPYYSLWRNAFLSARVSDAVPFSIYTWLLQNRSVKCAGVSPHPFGIIHPSQYGMECRTL